MERTRVLRRSWEVKGNPSRGHPCVEKEYYLDVATGDDICLTPIETTLERPAAKGDLYLPHNPRTRLGWADFHRHSSNHRDSPAVELGARHAQGSGLAGNDAADHLKCQRGCKMATTDAGYVNGNGLVNLGRGVPQRLAEYYEGIQYVYVMHCRQCGENCGTAGSMIWNRKCPFHQGGEEGPRLNDNELSWRP